MTANVAAKQNVLARLVERLIVERESAPSFFSALAACALRFGKDMAGPA